MNVRDQFNTYEFDGFFPNVTLVLYGMDLLLVLRRRRRCNLLTVSGIIISCSGIPSTCAIAILLKVIHLASTGATSWVALRLIRCSGCCSSLRLLVTHYS